VVNGLRFSGRPNLVKITVRRRTETRGRWERPCEKSKIPLTMRDQLLERHPRREKAICGKPCPGNTAHSEPRSKGRSGNWPKRTGRQYRRTALKGLCRGNRHPRKGLKAAGFRAWNKGVRSGAAHGREFEAGVRPGRAEGWKLLDPKIPFPKPALGPGGAKRLNADLQGRSPSPVYRSEAMVPNLLRTTERIFLQGPNSRTKGRFQIDRFCAFPDFGPGGPGSPFFFRPRRQRR